MRRRTLSPTLIFILILLLFLFSTSFAFAQVQTRVRVVYASNVGAIIDPLLGDLHNQLRSVFSFTSYRLLGDVSIILIGNNPIEVFVHRGRSIELALVEKHRDMAEMKIMMRMKEVPILNTQVRLSSGKTVFIGGPLYEEGAAIIALSANF
jgi:hypothetical protein